MADSLFGDILYNNILVSDGYDVEYAVCTTYKPRYDNVVERTIYVGHHGRAVNRYDAFPTLYP